MSPKSQIYFYLWRLYSSMLTRDQIVTKYFIKQSNFDDWKFEFWSCKKKSTQIKNMSQINTNQQQRMKLMAAAVIENWWLKIVDLVIENLTNENYQ